MSLLACQVSIPSTRSAAERNAHVIALCAKIQRVIDVSGPVDLVVLPELCTIEYGTDAFAHLDVLAEPATGPSSQAFTQLACNTGAMVVFGLARSTERGYFISQLIIDRSGRMAGCYDKMHLCQYGRSTEKDFFLPGDKVMIAQLNGWRIAPILCYDIRIPELSRTLALDHEATLLLHCGAYFRDESFSSWHSFAVTRAMENQVYLLSLNRAGTDYGGSLFCPPWVDDDHLPQYFPTHEQAFVSLELDPDLLTRVRSRYTFLKDRHRAYSI